MPTLDQILGGAPLLTLHVNVPLQPEPSVFLLQRGITIGRGRDNAIVVDHPSVGETHAQVYEDPETGLLRARCLEPFFFTTTNDLEVVRITLQPDATFHIGEVRFDCGVIELRTARSTSSEAEPAPLQLPPPLAMPYVPAIRAACPRCHESILNHPASARFCSRCGLELPENCPPWNCEGELNLSNPALAAYAHALFNLGSRYENMPGGVDIEQAIRYYEKAAKIGVPGARARLEARE
ncbi:MAG: FHA domain-containing protein [Anaerolineae bacterium]|nr:FHA domain-containing protein [Phycisphaerae bacterium]